MDPAFSPSNKKTTMMGGGGSSSLAYQQSQLNSHSQKLTASSVPAEKNQFPSVSNDYVKLTYKGTGGGSDQNQSMDDADKFGHMLLNKNAMTSPQMNHDRSQQKISEYSGFTMMASRIDEHLRQSNLNYVMRRSTIAALNFQENQAASGVAKSTTMRTATQVIAPRSSSLYRKGISFQQGANQRKPSFNKAGAAMGLSRQYGASEITQSQISSYMPPPQTGNNTTNNNAMIQDVTPESSFKIQQRQPLINTTTVLNSSDEKPSFLQSSNEFADVVFSLDTLHQAIQDNDIRMFRRQVFNQSNSDLVTLRFMEENLNIIQAICFYNADLLIEVLRERFKDDKDNTQQLVNYEEPSAGNKALHFAVLSGNIKIIDYVLLELQADAKSVTSNGLNALHCAAQIDRGALSLMIFTQRQYGLQVNAKDAFDCTPLHFAVINVQFKCVECLLALGADPNAPNSDGQAPLHIAVQKYIQMNSDRNARKNQETEVDYDTEQMLEEDDEALYEDLKRIMKELLFNGARRDLKARFELASTEQSMQRFSTASKEVTPFELLFHFQPEIPSKEYRSLKIILDNYSYNQCLMTHRPLQKVEKSAQLMVTTIVLNILIFLLFVLFQIHYMDTDNEGYEKSYFKYWSMAVNILFFFTSVFYFLAACVEPGFVVPQFDIIELLRIANDKSIDLENFCFYCRVIKSGRTFHCTFCQRCVEKFDHHCSFVNNCLGYRNHKYFLIFIIAYFLYFIAAMVASIMSFGTHQHENDSFSRNMDIVFRILSIGFNVTQFIPLFYQMKEQTRKLCRRGSRFKGIRRVRRDSHYSGSSGESGESGDGQGTSIQRKAGRSSQRAQSFMDIVETKAGFCYNLGQVFRYRAPTQEELKAFLFSDSERFSTFVIKYSKRKDLVDSESNQSSVVRSPSAFEEPRFGGAADHQQQQPLLHINTADQSDINNGTTNMITPPDSYFKRQQ